MLIKQLLRKNIDTIDSKYRETDPRDVQIVCRSKVKLLVHVVNHKIYKLVYNLQKKNIHS